LESVNYFAVVAAAVSTFVIGGVWYSPLLFHRAWMKANRFTEADLATRSPGTAGRRSSMGQGRIFGLAFVFAVIMSLNLAMFLNAPDTTTAWGATAGALTAVWVVLGIATVALFERRPFAYIAVNGGYWLVSFVVMGAIIGAWR
jgi:hypothetical protein